MGTFEKPFTLLALLSAMPGAYLAFKRSFIHEIREQMVDLQNPAGVGTNTVRFRYRLFAYIFVGRKENWMELFNPTSEEFAKAFKADKTSGLRVFGWFLFGLYRVSCG